MVVTMILIFKSKPDINLTNCNKILIFKSVQLFFTHVMMLEPQSFFLNPHQTFQCIY